jgi:integrase
LAVRQGDRNQWVDPAAGKVTFGEYARAWLGRQGHLRPRTRELYASLLRLHIEPTFGKRPLSSIVNSEVVAWHQACAPSHPVVKPKAYRLLAQIMRAAVGDGLLVKNPAVVKGAAGEPIVERSVPTVAEVEALAGAVAEQYRPMVLLAAWCALRFGEVVVLHREQIDLLHGEVRVTETLTELGTGERLIGPPKTAAGRRSVAIPPHVLPVIEAHLARIGAEPTALLFPGPDGAYFRRGYFYHQLWTPALKSTGLAYRFHDLRHSGLTWAAASGATVAELMHRAGHASSRAALRYQHATRDRDQAIARALSGLARTSEVIPIEASK